MHIGELQRVQDLAEGERALPEHGTTYRLRSIDNTAVETHVEFVVRRDRQFDRLLRQMHHALRIDLLDLPEIRGIVWPQIDMGRAFLPTVKAPLVRAHEILAREHWMHLVPDDGLAEI